MASNRIKGITIEIDGNTTKLQDSLKDVNKNLKDTQTQLKDVDKLLKLDPKNIELLAQKQELLGRQTENIADKLKKLRDAQQQMKDAGIDTMSDDYMAVEREIISCEKEQEKLTAEAKKTDEQIVQIGSGFDQVATKAQAAADATKPISEAAAAGLAGMAGLALKAGESADEINTLSKQTGIASDTIQKMKYAADLIDVDLNTAVSAIGKLKKGLDKNEGTLKSMGVEIKNQNGSYRNMEDIFMDTIGALSNIEDEVERDKVAMDLFGKSADQLAGYIDDGGQAYRELAAAAEEKGLIISQEDLDKANEFNDTLDELKATVGMDLLKAGADIAEALAPALQTLADVITKITDAFANMGPTGQKVVIVLLALLAALSPVLGLIAKIATIIPLLAPVISTIGGALGAVAGVISGPVLLAIGAVIAAIAIWVKNWDEIKAGFQAFGEIVANAWTRACNQVEIGINKIRVWFAELKESLSQTWENIKTDLGKALDAAKAKWDEFKQKFDDWKNKIKSGWNDIKNMLKQPLPKPNIKLPHIKITGSWSWNPPKAPSFGIEWYKKAMDDAYILNGATIFGQSGGQLLGGGEAGSEAVVGTDKLIDMMSEAVGNQNITVVLQGDAAQVFSLVRAENQRFFKANGYSPLVV